MRGAEAAANLFDDVGCSSQLHAFGSNLRSQTAAGHILHNDVGFAVRHLAGVKDTDDIRVIDAREGLDFLTKLLATPFVLKRIREQHFDHYLARDHLLVASEIHGPKPTLPEFFLNAITTP